LLLHRTASTYPCGGSRLRSPSLATPVTPTSRNADSRLVVAIGITTKQARNARLRVARAGERVTEPDPRFARIKVERIEQRPKRPRYELRVVRKLDAVAVVGPVDDADPPASQLRLSTD